MMVNPDDRFGHKKPNDPWIDLCDNLSDDLKGDIETIFKWFTSDNIRIAIKDSYDQQV